MVSVADQGGIWHCDHCRHQVELPDVAGHWGGSDDEEEDPPPLGMTVGDLRKAMEGVPDCYVVTLRVTESETDNLVVGSVFSAALEDSCAGMHFAIDGSDSSEDFDAE